MLEKYTVEQPNACKLLINCENTDRYSHAYLFVVNGYTKSYDFIYSFIKTICCPSSLKNCSECNICRLIDENSFSDFKLIDTEALNLKKEEILQLQDYFDTKKLYGKRRVYLIKDCDKMNVAASNTLLKFLEEPEEDIIAILTTNNISQVLDTIKSRCQVIYFSPDECNGLKDLFFQFSDIYNGDYEQFCNKVDIILDFCLFDEKNGISTIAFTKKKWHDYFNDRVAFKSAFNLMLYIYLDVINIKIGRNLTYFFDYIDSINMLATYHDLMYYIRKVKVIERYLNLIKYNVNLNLILDKVIMEWEGDVNEKSSWN